MTLRRSPPARATIEKQTAGGKIKSIEKEEEDGKVIYDVEATVQGRDVEYDIAADGTVLTSEQSVPYASLPLAVRNAAEKYFGSAAGSERRGGNRGRQDLLRGRRQEGQDARWR